MIRKRKDPGEGEGQKSDAKEPWKFHEQDYTCTIIMGPWSLWRTCVKKVQSLCQIPTWVNPPMRIKSQIQKCNLSQT